MQEIKTDQHRTKYYYWNSLLHREDGPAIERVNGNNEWYLHGYRHRKDGPAFISGKIQKYWLNGKLHREDGPAVIYYEEFTEWYYQGLKHRINGPAVEYSDGFKRFYLNGKIIESEEEYWRLVKLKAFW
jgi:hypothetical protein